MVKLKSKYIGFLSGTALKVIALVAMTVDHLGMLIFGNDETMRIIGRLAFPIFAFMIAEGCRYTKHKLKYFLSVFAVGLICQAVYFVTEGSLFLNILLSLSYAILIIYSVLLAQKKSKLFFALTAGLIAALVLGDLYLKSVIPAGYNYAIDYGIAGVMLPVLAYIGKGKWQKLLLFGLGLIAVAYFMNTRQYYALLSLIPLSLYNGKAGKHRMKYFFYLYYPLHLAVIYGISMLI